jgi:hypothetical protein
VAYAAQAIAAVAATASVVVVWRGRASPPLKSASLALGTLVASPYVHNYDLAMAALVPLWQLAALRDDDPRRLNVLMAATLLLLAPILVPALAWRTGARPVADAVDPQVRRVQWSRGVRTDCGRRGGGDRRLSLQIAAIGEYRSRPQPVMRRPARPSVVVQRRRKSRFCCACFHHARMLALDVLGRPVFWLSADFVGRRR